MSKKANMATTFEAWASATGLNVEQVKGAWADRDYVARTTEGAVREVDLEIIESVLALFLMGHIETETIAKFASRSRFTYTDREEATS